MQDITTTYLEIHDHNIRCPKCKGEDILIGINEQGYFWVIECNDCGYKGRKG